MSKGWLWLSYIVLYSSMFLLLLGAFLFTLSIHSIDYSHNMMMIEKDTGVNYVDAGLDFETRELEVYYISGFRGLIMSFFICLVSLSVFIITLQGVIQKGVETRYVEEEKEDNKSQHISGNSEKRGKA